VPGFTGSLPSTVAPQMFYVCWAKRLIGTGV